MSISQLDDYTPIGWQNYASGGTKLNATNLNHGDNAIDANRDKINEVVSAVNTATSYIEATETLTGNPIEIVTAVAENLTSCEIGIVAQQDLNGYDKPWAGGSGKNLANTDLVEVGTAWNGASNTARARLVLSVNASTTYTLSINGTSGIETVYVNTASSVPASGSGNAFTTSVTITTGASDAYMIIGFNKTNITLADIKALNLQLEVGSTATAYEPYENICEITGMSEVTVNRSGKNFANPQNASNPDRSSFTYSEESDDTITATKGVSGGKFFAKFTASVVKGQTYTFSFGDRTVNGTTTNAILYLYSDDLWGTNVGNFTINTSTKSATWTSTLTGKIAIGVYSDGGETSGSVISLTNFMVRLSSDTDSTFEPYNGTDYTFSIGSTCYGGTLNTKTGVLTVTHASVTGFTRGSLDSSGKLYQITSTNGIASWTDGNSATTYLISNYFETESLTNARATQNKCLAQYATSVYVGGYVGDETTLDTILTNLQIVYKLATPTTITLTPQEIALISGENTLSTDGNSMTASYSVSLADVLRRLKALES